MCMMTRNGHTVKDPNRGFRNLIFLYIYIPHHRFVLKAEFCYVFVFDNEKFPLNLHVLCNRPPLASTTGKVIILLVKLCCFL